jgi:hypothetical protein
MLCFLVPGPPWNLQVNETKENSLSISWSAPDAPEDFVTEFQIYAELNKTFDSFVSFLLDLLTLQCHLDKQVILHNIGIILLS